VRALSHNTHNTQTVTHNIHTVKGVPSLSLSLCEREREREREGGREGGTERVCGCVGVCMRGFVCRCECMHHQNTEAIGEIDNGFRV